LKTPSGLFTALHLASINGNSNVIGLILSFGADVNSLNQQKQAGILIAACNGHAGAVNVLLQAKADQALADLKGRIPLYHAVRNQHFDIVAMLLDACQDVKSALVNHPDACGHTLLHAACRVHSWQLSQLLLENGSKVDATAKDGSTPLLSVAIAQVSRIPDRKSLKACKSQPMHLIIRELLKREARVDACNCFGSNILHILCGSGQSQHIPLSSDTVSIILQHLHHTANTPGTFSNDAADKTREGNQEAVLDLLEAPDHDGMKPLQALCQYATQEWQAPMASKQLANLQDCKNLNSAEGNSDSSDAATTCKEVLKMAHLLISAGVDVNAMDYGDTTALMYLCWGAPTACGLCVMRCLLNHGADPTKENAQQWGALHILAHQMVAASSQSRKEAIGCYRDYLVMFMQQDRAALQYRDYLRRFDASKASDPLDNKKYISRRGAHNRIPLEQRLDVLRGMHTLEGIAAYVQRFRAQNARWPKSVVLAGAGISTAAGIPDFRSSEGLYAQNIRFDAAAFKTVEGATEFWDGANAIFGDAVHGRTKPTAAHQLLRTFQDNGALLRVYTQNIDMLEAASGIHDGLVVEAHGSLSRVYCTLCKKSHSKGEKQWCKLWEKSAHSPTPPSSNLPSTYMCGSVRCQGLLRPAITFFGEALPTRFHEHCFEDMQQAELLIVMGTTLVVYPFAGLVNQVGPTVPRLLINREVVGPFKLLSNSGGCSDAAFRDAAYIGEIDVGAQMLLEATKGA